MWKDSQCSMLYNSKRLERSLVPSNTELTGCGVSLHGFMNIMEYYAASQNYVGPLYSDIKLSPR